MVSHIQLAFRLHIGPETVSAIERKIFDASYRAFCQQVTDYTGESGLTRFTRIVQHQNQANALHKKCSQAIQPLLIEYKGKIPGLTDQTGRIRFEYYNPEFRLEESDTENPSLHRCSIIFHTEVFEFLQQAGEFLFLRKQGSADVFTLRMQEHLIVTFWEPVEEDVQLAATG